MRETIILDRLNFPDNSALKQDYIRRKDTWFGQNIQPADYDTPLIPSSLRQKFALMTGRRLESKSELRYETDQEFGKTKAVTTSYFALPQKDNPAQWDLFSDVTECIDWLNNGDTSSDHAERVIAKIKTGLSQDDIVTAFDVFNAELLEKMQKFHQEQKQNKQKHHQQIRYDQSFFS